MGYWDLPNTFSFTISVSLRFLPLGNNTYWWGLIKQEQWGGKSGISKDPHYQHGTDLYTQAVNFNFLDIRAHNTDYDLLVILTTVIYLDFCRLKMSYSIRPIFFFFFLSTELISEESESTRMTPTWPPSLKCHRTSLLNPRPLTSYSGLLSFGGTGTLPSLGGIYSSYSTTYPLYFLSFVRVL